MSLPLKAIREDNPKSHRSLGRIYLAYECKKCLVEVGILCVSKTGRDIPAPASHHARWQAAVADGALPVVWNEDTQQHEWSERARQILESFES